MIDPCNPKKGDKIGPCVGPGNGPGKCGICGREKELFQGSHLCKVCDLIEIRRENIPPQLQEI